ncbi:MAG: glycosyltransferase family 2 protein, partial [Bacteroidetes bacterium]|nr:glycosyltransferase family 2 protein [Bacteroidota bacterium]
MRRIMNKEFSIVIPAKNEEKSLAQLLPKLTNTYTNAEIIIINDGSSDRTIDICLENKVICVTHPDSRGNGAAIKTGARTASSESILFMDADGQHKVEDIQSLIEKYEQGHDMVVGARSNSSQASIFRRIGNSIYNRLASFMTGYKIEDLTSGFRIVNRKKFLKFLYLLPNGFSYPTTSTMAFFRSGYSVAYIPIHASKREGKSHINLLKD